MGGYRMVRHRAQIILTEDGELEDVELRQFIQDITKSKVYSIFLLSRVEFVGDNSDLYATHRVSLFPEEKHVTNLLDDYINRGEYNIETYPEALFMQFELYFI